jgi:hypothetical protein
MSPDNAPLFPIDPKNFSRDRLPELISRYWRLLAAMAAVLCLAIFAISLLMGRSPVTRVGINVTTLEPPRAPSPTQAPTRRPGSASIQMGAGDSWSYDGVTAWISNPTFDPGCAGAFGFVLHLEAPGGFSTLTNLDATAPSMIITESSGYEYSSLTKTDLWYQPGEWTGECFSGVIQDSDNPLYTILVNSGTQADLAIRAIKVLGFGVDEETEWVSIRLPQVIPLRDLEWIIPVTP